MIDKNPAITAGFFCAGNCYNKLEAYLTKVDGEDPEMLSVWTKISPEKAAVYANKLPAPQNERRSSAPRKSGN